MIASRPTRRCAIATVVAVLTLGITTTSAHATGSDIGGEGVGYYLSDTFSGQATTQYSYGATDNEVYVGDWDGDGIDTLAVRRGATFYVRNSHTSGPADVVFSYGNTGDTVIVGDWDGDGTSTLAVRRGNQYHIKNSIGGGVADTVVHYGDTRDAVLVGDWDGDGIDTLAVRRDATYYLKNSMTTGVADHVVNYGNTGDTVLVGDWDGSRTDTLAVRRNATYYLKNSISSGVADSVIPYGDTTDTTLVGDWNGDGTDTLGVRRNAVPAFDKGPGPGISFGDGGFVAGQVPSGIYRSTGSQACYWERVSGLGGTLEESIQHGYGDWQPIVRIEPTDAGFVTFDCGTWRSVRSTYPPVPATTIGVGTFIVGGHISAGTYSAPGGLNCFWQRSAGITSDPAAIISEQYGALNPVVVIPASDRTFVTAECGTWTKVG